MINSIVLLVDDSIESLDIACNALEKTCKLQVASSALKALEFLKKMPAPDLILLDILMPEMDGFELISKLKENTKTKDIPVIFLTVKNNIEDIIKGFNYGAVDFIQKPFNIKELQKRVTTHLTIQHQQKIINKKGRENQELIHILCHDLKNILLTVLLQDELTIDFAEEEDVSKKIKSSLISSKHATTNAVGVISLVQKMQRFDDDGIELTSLNLKTIIIEAKMLLANKFLAKNIELLIDVPDDLSVYADKSALINSVFLNLLTNAIKFTKHNSFIKITAGIKNNMALIVIQDNGIGIPQYIIENIFEFSSKTHRIGLDGEKGSGFGIPIAKKFLKIFNGDLKFISKDIKDFPDDHGTRIEISIPTKKTLSKDS